MVDFTANNSIRLTTINEINEASIEEQGEDWFNTFWQRKRTDLSMGEANNSRELMVMQAQLDADLEKFWKFRATNIMKLMQLHMHRRARMIAAFGFMRFKSQTLRMSVHQLQ